MAVRIIRDREIEIENFKPEEYWNIDANLKPRQSGCAFVSYTHLAQQGGHRFVHAANGLEQLFKAKFRHDDRCV